MVQDPGDKQDCQQEARSTNIITVFRRIDWKSSGS